MKQMRIRWEVPPPRRRKSAWRNRLAPLMRRPGDWARLRQYPGPTNARSVLTLCVQPASRALGGRWEFTTRAVDAQYAIYGRYLGPDTCEERAANTETDAIASTDAHRCIASGNN